VGIHPGRYNVFNEDGSLFKWGKESVHASLTMKNRVQFFIGDNEEPEAEHHLPRSVQTMNDFDKYTHTIFQGALIRYVAHLGAKLAQYQNAYREIIDQKAANQSAMILGGLPVWRWIEKTKELNDLQEIAQELGMETHAKLVELAPKSIEHVFIFTQEK
jgi:hypothetical protein